MDTQQRDRRITEHTELAHRIAWRVARRLPPWIPRDDLISAGMIGLIEAASRYDDSRAESFAAFAHHRIRGAVVDELRCGDIMPRRKRRLARRIKAIIRDLSLHGESVTDERIAAALEVSVETYRDQLADLVNVAFEPFSDAIPAVDEPIDELVEHRRTLESIKTASATLAPRDAKMITLHYSEGRTLAEIASSLGVSTSRVAQLLPRAVAQLRKLLAPTAHVSTSPPWT